MKKNILLTLTLGIIFSVLGSVLITQGALIKSGADEHWAWNDILNYIDFRPATSPNNVDVSSSQLVGYASSSIGEIYLNCASTPSGPGCGGAAGAWKVSNDGTGKLTGWGWNDAVGWVSFCGVASGGTADCPNYGYNYQVEIYPDGDFYGFAWNDIVGYVGFNCRDTLLITCPPNDYKLATAWQATSTSAWVESVTYDTEVTNGAQLNSIAWRGNQPIGTKVRFQLAVATSSAGPWEEVNYTWNTVDIISPEIDEGKPASISYAAFPPRRYFRYKVWLFSDTGQTLSPRVDEVIVNWSQ
jgi:hypothetical protein